MPFGSAIVAMRMLDQDQGDEYDFDFDTSQEQLLDALSDRLLSFEFSDHSRKKDKLTMTWRNDDYSMFDRPVFARGQKLLVTWGWPGETAPPRRVIVKSIKGGEEIVVTCHCTLSLLDQQKRSRFMAGATDAEWVKTIADEYRYTGTLAHIEPTDERRDITQPKWMTDAKMLRKLARRNGFEFYIDSTGLHWHNRPTDRTTVHDYIYRTDPGVGDVLEPPKFEANLSQGVSRVRVVCLDPIRKTYVDQSVGISDEEDVSLGLEDELFDSEDDDVGLRGNRIGEEEVLHGGIMSEVEARARAAGMYRETAKNRYKITLEVIGNPEVGAKNLIGLWGDISETVAGLYYVNEAITRISSGEYRMTLNCRKDALQAVKASKKRPRRNRVNQKAEKYQPEEKSEELQIYLTPITLPSGEVVPGRIWSDDGGKTGQTRQLTDEEFNALSDYQRDQLRYEAGGITYPDP